MLVGKLADESIRDRSIVEEEMGERNPSEYNNKQHRANIHHWACKAA